MGIAQQEANQLYPDEILSTSCMIVDDKSGDRDIYIAGRTSEPCEEQVEDGASGLIVSGSAPELAAAIASLMDDAQRRAAFGRRAAEKPLPPDEGSDRLRAFLKG